MPALLTVARALNYLAVLPPGQGYHNLFADKLLQFKVVRTQIMPEWPSHQATTC